MSATHDKVNRTISGIQYLMSRNDTDKMVSELSRSHLESSPLSPDIHSCRLIMRDNLTIIAITAKVNLTEFQDNGDESYSTRYVSGKGTTFEMALFDLSAQLISLVGDNTIIDTEELPLHNERRKGEKSFRTDQPAAPDNPVGTVDKDGSTIVETRSDNSRGDGTTQRGDIIPKRKSAKRYSGGRGSKQSRERS